MSKPKTPGLTRRASGLMALEQRYMFDGAAVADALAAMANEAQPAEPESTPVQTQPAVEAVAPVTVEEPGETTTQTTEEIKVGATTETSAETTAHAHEQSSPIHKPIFEFGDTHQDVPPAITSAQERAAQQINVFMSAPDAAAQLFQLFSANQSQPSAQWLAQAESFLNALQSQDITVRMELRNHQELLGAFGAFAAQGPDGQAVIYLNRDWAASASSEAIARVLVEEFGHYIDHQINQGVDTAGDEGEAFAGTVLGDDTAAPAYATDNDHLQLVIDGELVGVETSGGTFDVDGDPVIFNTFSTLVSGTSVGAKRLYTDVVTVDGQKIDAIITLTGLSNATVSDFDSIANPYGGTAGAGYFQPSLNISSVGGNATFTIQFILGGSYNASTNPSGTAVTLRNVLGNTYDLDGAGASSNGRQFTDFTGIGGFTLSSTTKITVSNPSAGVTRFITTVGGNVESLPGTAAGDNIRARVSFDAVSLATIKVGDNGATGLAFYGIDFSSGPVFTNAVTADVSITSSGPVTTSETGTSDTFSVVLTSAPTADVTVTLTGLDTTEGSLSTTTLTFTPLNWNTPQTVTVTGADDPDVDGDIKYTITASSSSTDIAYSGITALVDVTNTDNDTSNTPLDWDGDGVLNEDDLDDDNDGILDIEELRDAGAAPITVSNITFSYAQNTSGFATFHDAAAAYGSGDRNDPTFLFDGDPLTELRVHATDVYEFGLPRTISAGASFTLTEASGGNDAKIAVLGSLGTTDANGNTNNATGGGLGWKTIVARFNGMNVGGSARTVSTVADLEALFIANGNQPLVSTDGKSILLFAGLSNATQTFASSIPIDHFQLIGC